ncbi:MAG: hypothetical protein ACTSPB_21160 [Candidatus Thorarchaeota archaeon]
MEERIAITSMNVGGNALEWLGCLIIGVGMEESNVEMILSGVVVFVTGFVTMIIRGKFKRGCLNDRQDI